MMRVFTLVALTVVIWMSFVSLPLVAHEILPLQGNEIFPLQPEPVQHAEHLKQPAQNVYLALAKAMHEAQEKQLAEAKADGVWRCHFILGLAFALEEYYQLELSFPDCVSHLEESGYLLEGWREAGMALVAFTADSADCNEWTLIYVPQPVGLASIIKVPGRINVPMRSYTEYSLLVPQEQLSLWKPAGSPPRTWWIRPFWGLNVAEIAHFSKAGPGVSSGLAVSRSPYLAVSAQSAEGVQSVTGVGLLDEIPYIDMWGGKPFLIRVVSTYPLEPTGLYITVSDGRLYSLTDSSLEFNCKYLARYYGLVIAVYPDDTVGTSSFWMFPGWRIPDAHLIPKERPKPQKPTVEDEKFQQLIDEWWEDTVVAKEKKYSESKDNTAQDGASAGT